MTTATAPPRPPGSVLLGNAPALARDRLGSMTRWTREYGDIVGLRFGPMRAFLVTHPDLVQEVLVNQHHSFVRPYVLRMSRLTFGESLFVASGPKWKRRRRLAQSAFHRQAIALYADGMAGDTRRMLGRWHDGDRCDAHEEMMRLTLGVVARALFDADVESDAKAVGRALGVVMRNFTDRMDSGLPFPDTLPTPGNLRLRRALRELDAVILRIIGDARAGREDRPHLISMLLHARDDEGMGLTDRELRDEAVAFVLAGHETTALALTWTFLLLSRHPEVEAKMHAELDEVLSGRAPGPEDLEGLPYTGKVLREALRLYPPAYAFARDSIEDVELGQWRVPARSTVIVSPWVAHRDPRWWDRPDEYDPDRWTPELLKRLKRFEYFPFGGGPHLCIGAGFAMLEATIILAMVAQRFRLEADANLQVEPEALITLRPRGGLPVTLRSRPAAAPARQEDTVVEPEALVTVPDRVPEDDGVVLATFEVRSEAGNERIASAKVEAAVSALGLAPARLERLKTATAEAVMNAIEHGNRNRPELMVGIAVVRSGARLSVRVTDQGSGQPIPERTQPDLEAKLAGLETPRGWGLFLIRNLVDELNIPSQDGHHTVELVMHLEVAPALPHGG